MVRQRIRWIDAHGISIAELMVVLAVIGLFSLATTPFLLSYWRAATLTSGAQELQTILNSARQLAIRQNQSICVSRGTNNRVRFLVGGCAGTAWIGTGTDANGWLTLANSVEVSATTADVVFTYLGAASTAGQYTVRNPVNTAQALTVTVAASGRVTIP